MSSVNEWIVREYFESLGYLVIQPCKYSAAGKKKPEEHISFIIHNPAITENVIPGHLIWATEDLKSISGAIIGILGWHTDRFYPASFEQAPEIYRFAEDKTIKSVARKTGLKNPAKILCLPQFPVSEKLKHEAIELLKSRGIDGVLTFRTLLLELARSVNVNRNYEKSALLQIIRLLKNYGLLKDDQMELFVRKNKKK